MKSILGKYSTYKLIIIIIISVAVATFVMWPSPLNYQTAIVEQMPFQVEVMAEGEIKALEFERITIPELLTRRELRIWELKINDLVPEGTKVKKGDFVASLNPSEVEDRLKRREENIEEFSNALESALLDSTIVLMEKREGLEDAKDDLSESKIKVEQSVYESEASQRKAKIELEKAQLKINTRLRNYEKEVLKQKTKIRRIKSKLDYENKLKELLEELLEQLEIKSPSDGMVVYGRSWGGRKIKVDDDVGPWRPLIATIPNLNTLVSEAIVKEIDIAKIKVNQKVNIAISAFPEEEFEGKIIKIANIGQPIRGAGMNGFKVVIQINNVNNTPMLPSMTTINKIITAGFPNSIVVPRMAVFTEDSLQVVFLKNGNTVYQKQVKTAEENEEYIRIIKGLKQGDEVLLVRPEKFENVLN